MKEARVRNAITVLQWSLGMVVLVEAAPLVIPSARHGFSKTGLPDALRLLLGWGEIVGAVLFLIPKTLLAGGWILGGTFLLAIAVHLLHGMWNVGALVVYAAVVWAVISVSQ
jgi:hypothetical protein